ncbi:MAG: sterol desaturase family protein [Bacteroidetes bacterium]|nr:sterol desaturase family protein [Bacteroidota bacterium]MBS1931347.1 sterol desaturase family protein [Bacteroidota bacterium]
MGAFSEQLLLLVSTPVYIVVIGAELLLSHLQHKNSYSWKDTVQNIYLMLINSGIDLLVRSIYIGVILTFFFEHRITNPISNPWLYWIVLLIFEDFMYYWLHRIDHYCRFFWATHVTHHSSPNFNFTVGFRSSVMEPLYRFVYFIPIAALGFQPVDIAFMYSATQIWGILVHTERINKMGFLEYILVTPSHHRVHHGSNAKYLDKNMGMFLIIWDKLFRTFQPELSPVKYQQIRYGLTAPLKNENPVNLIFHEWHDLWKDAFQKDIGWKERWNYIFGLPGWSHDGSRQTSKQKRKMEVASEKQLEET